MEIKYMQLAIQLAKKGRGFVNPNPLVGAVLVKEGKIIGKGYHQFYGGPHAEMNAINHANGDIKGATLYVTLEPCFHTGKTPPCVDTIIEHGVKEVVIGMKDPNPLVSGRSIEKLKKHGIQVRVGLLEEEVMKLNEIFIKYIVKNQPFVLMKTAMTLDGKIATPTGMSKWITNEASRAYVHRLRHTMSAIMVGIGTVLKDDPQLTTRIERDGKDPIRVIVDTKARIPLDAKVLNLSSKAKTIIATTEIAKREKIRAIEEKGAEVIQLPLDEGRVDLSALMKALGERQIDSVLVEGGGILNYSLIKKGLVDKIVTIIGPKIIGGHQSKTPIEGEGIQDLNRAIQLTRLNVKFLEEDLVIEGYIKDVKACLQG